MNDEASAVRLVTLWRNGDSAAKDELINLFYPRLERAASGLLSREQNVSLTPGDLVHETALRLIRSETPGWESRAHFLAVASKAMRRVLIDQIRSKNANKRRHWRVTLVTYVQQQPHADLRALNHALMRLAALDPEMAEIVEMRYFGGMSVADIAAVHAVSEPTVKRRWAAARAWLVDALENDF